MTEQEGTLEELLRENAELKTRLERLEKARLEELTSPAPAVIAGKIAELLRSNAELHRQIVSLRITEDQLRLIGSVVETAEDGILILTPAVEEAGPRVAYVNEAFARIAGIPASNALAQTLKILNLVEGDRRVLDDLMAQMFAGATFEGESLAIRGDGSEYTAEIRSIPVRGTTGYISHWILFVRDVSARRAQILTLERQAQFDPLTELPNRLLLFDRLEQAILLHRRTQRSVALMIMDLDRFKEVNDGFGHQYGDLLLKQVAFRLKNLIRQSDTVARLGGDEFAVVLPQVAGTQAAMEVAQKMLRAFETPFLIADKSFSVGASVGIALCPEHGEDAATLLRRADIAMYRAKQSGSEFCVFSAEQDQDPAGRYELIASLREAIEGNQLVLHYQPKVDLEIGSAVGAEALVRWQHPTEGLLYPDRFIHLAETSGLIKPMTLWIFNEAVRQIRKWRDFGQEVRLAVNLSPIMLRDGTLPETISGILDSWDIRADWLRVEITESSILADPAQAMAVLSLLRTLGVTIAIDDFGTGYSSLANLRQIPFDEIKIDKSFVMKMLENDGDAAIVRATIDLAHALGREVTAEGVENEAVMKRLAEWRCDMAQGYFISRPSDAEKFAEWLGRSAWAPVISDE